MRKRYRLVAVVVIALLDGLRPALAETRDDPAVELGVNINGLTSWWNGSFAGVGIRVGVPVNSRFSIESGIAFDKGGRDDVIGYGVHAKQRLLHESGATQPFLMYGIGGAYVRQHFDEYRYRRADGTFAVVPQRTDTFFIPPILGLFGGGIERQLARHITVRADAEVLVAFVVPVGLRATAGFSIPFGRSSSTLRKHDF